MLGWCCCDHWEHWKDWTPRRSDDRHSLPALADAAPAPSRQPAGLAQRQRQSSARRCGERLSASRVRNALAESDPLFRYADAHHRDRRERREDDRAVRLRRAQLLVRRPAQRRRLSASTPRPVLARRFLRSQAARNFCPTRRRGRPRPTGACTTAAASSRTSRSSIDAMEAVYAKPNSAADYERMAQTMEYDSERAMFEAYSRNKYNSTGVIQWMLNNAWPSMIWHLYDYYLDAGARLFRHQEGLRAAAHSVLLRRPFHRRRQQHLCSCARIFTPASMCTTSRGTSSTAPSPPSIPAPTAHSVSSLFPENLFSGAERIFFIDLSLTDATGHVVSHNFYWVPGTLTAFDWAKTDYTHTPAARHEDLTALAHLPAAQVAAHAEIENTAHGREIHVHLANQSNGAGIPGACRGRAQTRAD